MKQTRYHPRKLIRRILGFLVVAPQHRSCGGFRNLLAIAPVAPLQILHVEDDPDDAFFLRRAMRQIRPDCRLHLEKNGESAIQYLTQAESKSAPETHPLPNLLLLDLKLPGMSGFEVLSWARGRNTFKDTPILMLSGSSLKEDRTKAAALGASDFLVKNSDYDGTAAYVVQFLENIDSKPTS